MNAKTKTILEAVKETGSPLYWLAVAVKNKELSEAEAGQVTFNLFKQGVI